MTLLSSSLLAGDLCPYSPLFTPWSPHLTVALSVACIAICHPLDAGIASAVKRSAAQIFQPVHTKPFSSVGFTVPSNWVTLDMWGT